jgi:hypothetical protein
MLITSVVFLSLICLVFVVTTDIPCVKGGIMVHNVSIPDIAARLWFRCCPQVVVILSKKIIRSIELEIVVPIIIILTVIIQAFFIFHVFRTGRPYWWAFIILSFPIAGCLIYYFVEIFPSSREHRSARKVVRDIAKKIRPDAELAQRAAELEICGSIENKLNLAFECEQSCMYEEAVSLYRSCLSGMYVNDPKILFALARALLLSNRHVNARARLNQLLLDHPNFKPNEIKLLLARALEAEGDDGATRVYEELIPVFSGFEAKYRYGLHLKSMGLTKQANGIFEEIIEHARKYKVSHDEETQWVSAAKQARSV